MVYHEHAERTLSFSGIAGVCPTDPCSRRRRAYERQAEEAEKVLREDSSLPKASLFNYPSVLEKASSLIEELKKALELI